MAGSSNTTWLKGFSGNPDGQARGDVSLAELVRLIGGEWVVYPPGGDDAVLMMRREALVRSLYTRAVIDGDMTAIKLLVELLEGKSAADEEGMRLNSDDLAAAEALLREVMDDEHRS
jgi:hypothetical protein